MNNSGLVRACTDVYRIGRMPFLCRRYLIEMFMKRYRADQMYQHQIGKNTFYLISNKKSRAWFINVTIEPMYYPYSVGGFYQVIDKTFIIQGLDSALVPIGMYPKHGDFSFLNLQVLFMWISSYPELILRYGLRAVYPQTQDPEYIDVMKFLDDFLFE